MTRIRFVAAWLLIVLFCISCGSSEIKKYVGKPVFKKLVYREAYGDTIAEESRGILDQILYLNHLVKPMTVTLIDMEKGDGHYRHTYQIHRKIGSAYVQTSESGEVSREFYNLHKGNLGKVIVDKDEKGEIKGTYAPPGYTVINPPIKAETLKTGKTDLTIKYQIGEPIHETLFFSIKNGKACWPYKKQSAIEVLLRKYSYYDSISVVISALYHNKEKDRYSCSYRKSDCPDHYLHYVKAEVSKEFYDIYKDSIGTVVAHKDTTGTVSGKFVRIGKTELDTPIPFRTDTIALNTRQVTIKEGPPTFDIYQYGLDISGVYLQNKYNDVIAEILHENSQVKPLTVILYDIKAEDSANDVYKHEYKIIKGSGPTIKESYKTGDVGREFYYKHKDHQYKTIVSKNEKGEISWIVSPPGYVNFVGNNKYGKWEEDSNGDLFWEFYGKYAFMKQMLGLGNNRVSLRNHTNFRSDFDAGKTYTGKYVPISFKEKVRSQVARSSTDGSRSYSGSSSRSSSRSSSQRSGKVGRTSSRYNSSSNARSGGGGYGK